MPRINIHKNALSNDPEIHVVDEGTHLIDFLAKHAQWVGDCESVVVKRNGLIIADSTRDDLNKSCDVTLSKGDQIDVYAAPQGIEIGLTTALLIGLGAAAVSILLLPKPEVPNDAGSQKSSPNNQLNAATNEYRKNQAEAEIYGFTRVFPDFQQPSHYEYIDNRRVFTELLCLGVGYFEIDTVRATETPLSDIAESDYTEYPPGSAIPDQLIVIGSNEVDGFELAVPDNPDRELSLDGANVNSPNTIGGISTGPVEMQNGDRIYIDIAWNQSTTQDTLVGEFEVENVGAQTFDIVGVNLNDSQTVADVTGYLQSLSNEAAGQWFVTSGNETTEIRHQVIAPQGLMEPDKSGVAILLRLECQEVDQNGAPIGEIISQSSSISGRSRSAVKVTLKQQLLPPARYRARIIRTSESVAQGGLDRLQIEDIQSVRTYSPSSEGVTSILVKRATSESAQGQVQSKINVDATRKLELFDPATGTFANGVYTATRSAAQAVIDTLRRANESLSNIDYQSLFEQVPNNELGYFDFSFDDIDVSVGQRIDTICNAARIKSYKSLGTIWTFVRDQARPMAVKFFNRRNIHGDLSLERKHYISDEYDSIELKWVDPVTNDERFERRRINASTGAIEAGLGTRVQEITLAGCRNQLQASNRIEMEIRRLKYVKWTLSGTFGAEALTIGPMNKIAVADINDSETFDGEILEVEGGGLYRTTEAFEPEAGKTYIVMISEADGDVGVAVSVSPHPETKKGFSAPGLSGAVVADGYTLQVGSRYLIATESDVEKSYFSVTKRGSPDEMGRTQVEATQYDARIYEMD